MPTIHPHVHAFVGSVYAKIALPTHQERARIVRVLGKMKNADVAKAREFVQENIDLMWEGWNRFHG